MPQIAFDNSFAALPDRFYARLNPTPVAAPQLIRVNHSLASYLGLDPDKLESTDGLAMLAGNTVPAGAAPLAMAYAGHQFGGWSPQLGDGRAHLLGELIAPDGKRFDLQLKGSGPTPFSRMGDGRAALGPVLREYIVSEAMAALGVPTTRALAAVTTGEQVLREQGPLPGAVLTRVAASHIRVGTFQYHIAREDIDALRLLADHVIARHYPQITGEACYLDLLNAVIAAQAQLIARWMGLGFIHGVMNTDNMAIGGETIDYGPCAFMDTYHPDTVFSSIDQQGRYAYRNQPVLAQWNLAQLASSLLPLINADREAAIADAQAAIDAFPALYQTAWLIEFGRKLGLNEPVPADVDLINGLLDAMAQSEADFTQTFRALVEDDADTSLAPMIQAWRGQWQDRLAAQGSPLDAVQPGLRAANPAIIPRNHQVEAAIQAAYTGDFTPFHTLVEALRTPFDAAPDSPYRAAPKSTEIVHQTFCGT